MPTKEKEKEAAAKGTGVPAEIKQPEASVPAVIGQEGTDVAVVVPIAEMFEQDAGGGFEAADKDAYAIPFLSILQSGSPQAKRSDGAYIQGAEEGMLYNSVTQEIQSGEAGLGALVIPCYFTRRFTRWGARKLGGGLKGEYSPSDPILQKAKGEGGVDGSFGARLLADSKGEFHLDTSDILNDTRTHYVLVGRTADGKFATKIEDLVTFSPAVVSVTSTQIRKSRLWMSKMGDIKLKRRDGTLFTPPMFSHVYRLTTVPESNDQGSWYGWKVELEGQLTNAGIYSAARDFRDAVKKGEVKTQPLTEDVVSGTQQARTGQVDRGPATDDNIPF